MADINLNGSDRIVRPTFSGAGSRNASNAETSIMVAVSFGLAWLMLLGARDLGNYIIELYRGWHG